ncbi:hypothetical protein LWI28_003039 [Acer negundo]|uniref:Uncharacterized protein n=1 Tax=Acer negundo TaxID=4023 RepID=A0AAD5NIM5_ACENE|nr:hypothetical protein LWI28_003039 [Acer negundo]
MSVEYLCAHGKDPLRSREMSGFGKMSNVDRIWHEKASMWQRTIMGEMSTSYQKAMTCCKDKHAKLCDYRERVKRENAVDMFLASEEFYQTHEKAFDIAVKKIRALLVQSYLDFDFSAFDADVQKATESRVRKEGVPVKDKFEDF